MNTPASALTILVTGASGSVGREVVQQLLQSERHYRIIVFDKMPKPQNASFSGIADKDWIQGDISNPADIATIPERINAAIHLAAIIPPAADIDENLTRAVNTQGTQNLIQHLEQTSPGVFFVFASSVSVYGDRLHTPNITVNDPLTVSEGDVYGQSKVDAENIVKSSSLHWTIFRLTGIMSGHKLSKLMFHMPLDTTFEICTADDAARAFVNALDVPNQLEYRIFNLGGGQQACLPYSEFLSRSFKMFGLGDLDFPEFAFASRNFHCGRLADGDDLENILHFRRHTITSYFQAQAKTIPAVRKLITTVFRKPIKWLLLRQSEPYQAYKQKNQERIDHFFSHDDRVRMMQKA